MNSRTKKLCAKLKQKNIHGLIVTSCANITYLTNYPSRDSYFLVTQKECFYFTDSRYIQEAQKALSKTATIVKIDGSVFKLIAHICLSCGLKRIGFEERNLAFAEYQRIKKNLDKGMRLIPTHSLIEKQRGIKEPQEIQKISTAIRITSKALNFAKGIIKPGRREIEVVAELQRYIRYQGADGAAFEIIVASGANSSFPHHISSRKKICKNEPVLIDIGVDYSGYKSDLTRMVFLGRITSSVRKIYDIVLQAQNRAIQRIKPGQAISEIDKAARRFISTKGFGSFFGHNLGHGIGLEIHEEPIISSRVNERLKTNMVFTVEPAIYLPNRFGVRIEDNVLVTRGGCEVLSGFIHK